MYLLTARRQSQLFLWRKFDRAIGHFMYNRLNSLNPTEHKIAIEFFT
ncbi:hypothetical protein QUB25_07000 [Microcoleus sp. B3-D7]